MAGLMRNLVTRITVSAIVGAAVAGGIIWVSQDSVSRSLKTVISTNTTTQTEAVSTLQNQLSALLDASSAQMDAIANLELKIEGLNDANASLAEEVSMLSSSDGSSDAVAGLQSKIDALIEENAALNAMISDHFSGSMAMEHDQHEMVIANAAGVAEIQQTLSTIQSDLSEMKSAMAATPTPAEVPDFDTILDRMIDAVQRLDDMSREQGTK